KRSGGQILSLYKACGWMVFYGLTGLAFWALRFYSFRQDPLQELLASVTVALLLLSLLFFYRAFRPKLKCPIGGLMDLAAGLGVFGFVFFFALCWAAAFFPPNKSLAYLQPLASGQIDLKNPAGLQARITGTRLGRSLQFQVQYAVLSWPFFDI